MRRPFRSTILAAVMLWPVHAAFTDCEIPPKHTLLIATDATTGIDTVFFGHHPLATRGRDTVFCEREVPPMPPQGIFEFRFVNPPGYEGIQPPAGMGQGFYYDFRPQVSPTQIDTHRVRFQPSSGGYPMTFRWSPTQLLAMCDSAILIDEFGGAFAVARMHAESTLVVTNPAITTLLLYKFGTVETPAAPQLVSPPNGATHLPLNVTLMWESTFGAARYRVQVATDSLFAALVIDADNLTTTSVEAGPLTGLTTYYWRVNASNGSGTSDWSDVRSFTTTGTVTLQFGFAAGWNMISLPLSVANPAVTAVFPSAISSAFGFGSGGYVSTDTLNNGTGYWLKLAAPESVSVTGVPVGLDTIVVQPGWNLIGGITWPVDTVDITQEPSGIVISPYFGYEGAYSASNTLAPSKAYWVKSSTVGFLILQASPPRPWEPDITRTVESLSK